MRYRDIITEAPLASYDLHGDFDQDGSFDKKNRKLVSSPKHPERMERLLRAGKTLIAVHVMNVDPTRLNQMGFRSIEQNPSIGYSNLERVAEKGFYGETTQEELEERFGVTISPNSNAINCVLAGNTNGEDALTAWMMIHRLTHMVEDAATNGDRISDYLKESWKAFTYYVDRLWDHDPRRKWSSRQTLAQMVTMRSAPPNSELDNELLTQYLVKGRITLVKPTPETVARAFRHASTPIQPFAITDEEIALREEHLNALCRSIALNMIGSIFVSF